MEVIKSYVEVQNQCEGILKKPKVNLLEMEWRSARKA